MPSIRGHAIGMRTIHCNGSRARMPGLIRLLVNRANLQVSTVVRMQDGMRVSSLAGNAPESPQLSKRSIEFVTVAKPDAIDAMRSRAMNTIGVLPERPGLEGPWYVERLGAIVLSKPKKALGERCIGRSHASKLLLDEMAGIQARPASRHFRNVFNELTRLVKRHCRTGQVRFVVEYEKDLAVRLDGIEKKLGLV